MKIKVNYDLLDRINMSKNGTKLYKSDISDLNSPVTYVDLSTAILGNFLVYKIDRNLFLFLLSLESIFVVISLFFIKTVLKVQKKEREDCAKKDLQKLVTELYNLEVRTTNELIKESKLNNTKYKIVFTGDNIKIPRIKSEKEIIIPLSNGYEETLLQEHIFGDKDYDLSVKPHAKEYTYKTIKAV